MARNMYKVCMASDVLMVSEIMLQEPVEKVDHEVEPAFVASSWYECTHKGTNGGVWLL